MQVLGKLNAGVSETGKFLRDCLDQLADVFTSGDYHALEVSGPHRDHVVAFARRRGKDACIVAVMRRFAAFSEGGREWPRGT